MERRKMTFAAKLLQHSLKKHPPIMLAPNPAEGEQAK
jgi:hypothetical protein